MPLPKFYTTRYVEVESKCLSCWWLTMGLGLVLVNLILVFGQHSYVQRLAPHIDVSFWHDVATDGSGGKFPRSKSNSSGTGTGSGSDTNQDNGNGNGISKGCSPLSYYYGSTKDWGSDPIPCVHPDDRAGTFVYPSSNQVFIATSIARGHENLDPQWYSQDVEMYAGIDEATVVFKTSFATAHEVVPHVPHCKVVAPDSLLHSDESDGTGTHATQFVNTSAEQNF